MSNFGRGRGFRPQGTLRGQHAARRFGRPRFPRPPFRHAGPPRHPGPFGMSWQPNNIFVQPHPLRGTSQFRSDSRRRRFYYDVRFPPPNRLPVPLDYEGAVESTLSNQQEEINQNETVLHPPLLGYEEERQQKITETADRLKQKLSSFNSDEVTDIWNKDTPFNFNEDDYITNRRIPVVGYKSLELNLTYNDLKNIGKINSNNVKLDNTQHTTDTFNIINNTGSDVILNENENGSHLVISNDQMENVSDDIHIEYLKINNIELKSDLRNDVVLANVSQDQDDQEPTNITESTDTQKKQEESETSNLQAALFPINSVDQNISQKEDKERSQNKKKFLSNLESQENILNSHVHAESSNSSNSTVTQPVLADMSVNNVALDNQLSRVKENSIHNGPPKLSPHIEQDLPVDFDPTTPPPILSKQDQPRILPPYSISPDLPPLFDPTAPPPNIKLFGSKMSHGDASPTWSNAQNPMPVYQNIEVHTGLNTHGGFMLQQLPLEISNQNNVFLPSHVDFSSMFPIPSSSSGINTHVPSILPQMYSSPHNIYISPSSLSELSPSSDLPCSENKDNGLDDMQEAMKFAKEMTEKTDEESKSSSSKSLSESNISIKPINNIEFIALPPGKPKAKTTKLKKIKTKKIVPEEQNTAKNSSSEETIQDANVKCKDVALMNEQDRPKVIFNLNNKTKIINTTTWIENKEKKNGQSVESEKVHPAIKKKFERTLRHNKEEEKDLKRNEINFENSLSESNQDATSPCKKPQKDVQTEKLQCSSVSPYSKVNVQKSRNRIKQNDNSNMETSWKNKIISRFLKMSKNDICNMVNNTSLRKFDIIMKRLVKEKKPMLSLEMRHAQDEKMKLYDQQEFMKQLNAMLDTDATVSITDLPTEFIHHLNEVLQLDVQPDYLVESAAASTSQYDHSENTNYAFNPVTHITECTNKITSYDISQESIRNKDCRTKTSGKDIQTHNTKNNDLGLKNDTYNTVIANEPSASNLLSLQNDLDDIFSEVTKKIHIPAAVKERKRCITGQQNARRIDVGAISMSMEKEAPLKDDGYTERVYRLESYPRWDDKCDRWKRKEGEESPHAYRNLTKEEWEARYGTQANSTTPSCTTSFITKKVAVNDKKLSNKGRGRKCYPRRRHSSESSKHPQHTRHRTLEKNKNKTSRRHSDDRKHSTAYLEQNIFNNDSNSTNSSNSSSSGHSSSSSSTNTSDNTNVTKLLRVIKENEKVAKEMSLNEAIRDEVYAEIEQERKSRKLRKNKSFNNKRQKKPCYKKKKKQNKKTTSPSDSSSEKGNNKETTDKLLTESEIKKEAENQITQEVIVKEELDISQEENIENTAFASTSNFTMENKAAYYIPTSQSTLTSLSVQETPTVNAMQSQAQDRQPTTSPTQPKTKAQLKQMPETSDMNDNKVPLNVFTCIPEDWNTFNPANFSESMKDSNRTTDISCNQDKAILSTNDNFTNQNNTVHVPCEEANKSEILQELQDATVCTESSTKIQDSNEISANDSDVSRMSTVAVLATPVSSVTAAGSVTQKQGASKKIDIKTYYERTIQRRMNEKLESKRPIENSATSTKRENSITSKITEPEIAMNKFTYSGSIQDPRLASARVNITPCATNSKDNIERTTSRKNIRQKTKTTKISTIKELSPEEKNKRPEEKNSNRISDSVVEKINQDKSQDKVSLTANVNVLSNVVTTSKIPAPKSKKCSGIKENLTDKKLQSKISSDSKRFKHIRSEGSKELKLKKELAKEQKIKKKLAVVSSRSVNLISTKIYSPLEETTRTEEMAQEKKIDNISNIKKIEIEQRRLIDSRENEVNNSNMKMESTTISSGNIDNDGDELPRDVVKAKECSSSFLIVDILKRKSSEKIPSNIEDINMHEHSSKTTQDKETPCIKRTKDMTNVEIADKKSQSAEEICKIDPQPDISVVSKVILEIPKNKISNAIEKINEDFSTSEIQQSDATKNTELSLNHADQSQIKKSNNQDVSEGTINRDISNISESDVTSRSDNIDEQNKEDQSLIDSNKSHNIKENNMELDVDNTDKFASANKAKSLVEKIAGRSSASNENSQKLSSITSPGSIGSPFKGFLQETMIDFEQPNSYDLKSDDVNKKNEIFLDDRDENYATRTVNCKDTELGGRQDYETPESGTDYANDTSINANENFNITLDNALLASNKNCTTSEKGNKSDLTADESGEGPVRKSPSEIAETTTLHDEDNDISIEGGSETEKRLMSKEGYASCSGLVQIKDSMFINEEDIQGEAQSKDLASKLKTTTDPSLSDALETTVSDDALRLPESQGAEPLDNHIYLETNVSAEKTSCDKLPDFDSDEHLDNDIFYLDDRLRGAATFDHKDDDESMHFSGHEQSPRYDRITPTVTPETTIITSCVDLSKPRECKFDLKRIVSTESDLLAATSLEQSPVNSQKMLNIPTKAALREPTTNLFLKSASDVPMVTKEAFGIMDKVHESTADLNYPTSAWRDGGQNNIKTHPLESHNNTVAQDFTNVNTTSSTGPTVQNNMNSGSVRTDANHDTFVTSSANIEKLLHGDIQRNPVVELRKMKELDKLLEKSGQKKEVRKRVNEKQQKKRNGTILHRLKDNKQQMKYQSKGNRISLVKRLKRLKQSGKIANTTREAIMARMLEIDLEVHKLTTEKLKLHEILQNNIPSSENPATSSVNDGVTLTREVVADQSDVSSILTTQLAQNNEINQAKQTTCALSKSSFKGKKRLLSCDSETEEIVNYTPITHQKTKTPVIRWKKKPRLEQTIRREEDEDEEEEILDEMTEQQTSTSVSKNVEDCSIGASKDIAQKSESDAVVNHGTPEKKIVEGSDKEAACDIDSGDAEGHAVCSDKSTMDKNADDLSESQDFAGQAKYSDIDKQNDILSPSKAAKSSFQPSNKQVHSRPESLAIYSNDSTWNSLVQNTTSEMHENRKATGLVLLDETLKKLATSQKMKTIVRKKKKQQLDTFLRMVNKLTPEEEELPLSKLYIKKLQQKRDLLDSLSQRKEDTNLTIDPNVLKNMDEVINAVAKNRVDDLYEPQSETIGAPDDVTPATSSVSPVSQSDKHQFYVDAEANANSDWPCREKENVEEAGIASRQDTNDVPSTDDSNHVFKAVSQDKVPFFDEHNVEPDSSITPEETLIESRTSDCERNRTKDNITSCNFDIKVSVPKILIKDNFNLGRQKSKDTESGVTGIGLIDSTTNIFSVNSERLMKKDKNSQDISQAAKSIVEEDKEDEKGETKNKPAVNANEREEIVDSVNNAPSAPESSTAKSVHFDVVDEESNNSVASNRNDKMRDTEYDSSISNSALGKTDTKQKKSDAESEQLSNDAIVLKQDGQNTKNAKEEERSNPEKKSRAFEKILDHDQSTSNSIPADLTSEKSEESNEASMEQKSDRECTFTFNKATANNGETSMKKLRRKQGSSMPIRRSTRMSSNENVKSNKIIKETDANSNSSERESSVSHETNFTTRSRSKSPTRAIPDEKITNNESATSNNSTVIIAQKRKQHTEWQIKHCKVRLVDCKSDGSFPIYVNSEVLDKPNIIAVTPYIKPSSSDSCMQRTTGNQNTIISTTISGKDFFNKSREKARPEIEILEEKESSDENLIQESISQTTKIDKEDLPKLEYTVHTGPILDIKVFENSFLAASEDGKIYRYSQISNEILNIYQGHKSAVTCLYIYKLDAAGVNKELMYSGSLDGTLRCYNITTGELIKNPAQVNSAIQCMDQAWGTIFIGTKSGYVSRFNIKAGVIKGNSIPFADAKSVLALKATNEGPRRILIVASRNQPITIRDAQTGLFLRTISGQKNHTVYSLLRHNNLIYCGTSSTSINVFDFTIGEQVIQYDAGVGIVCMRLYKQFLFAGCYDGNIYVFDINNHKLICSIHGPGNMLLSIEVINNKIIAGSKDKRLHSWQMPTQVRALL